MTPRRVIVVDDHADAAEALAMLLEIAGHEVRIARDAAAALAEAERLRPDTALLDLSLPDLSGYELAEAMRQQPWGASMQFVAVTGWDSAEQQARARAAGFLGVLTKPIAFAELEALLNAPPTP